MKVCFKCGLNKSIADFYRHSAMSDGHLNKCIECTKADNRRNYAQTRPKRSAYEQKRSKTPARKAAQGRYGKELRAREPTKYKAWYTVSNAIRDGRLKRGHCETCGTTEKVQAHHHDYSKPLDVRWLCFRCHREGEHGQKVIKI